MRREHFASLAGDFLLRREFRRGGRELLLEAPALLVANLEGADELAELGPQLLLRGGGRAVGLDGELSLEQLLLVLLLDSLELRGVESFNLGEALVHGGAGDKLGLEVLDVGNLARDVVDELGDVALDVGGGGRDGLLGDGGRGRGGSLESGGGLEGLGGLRDGLFGVENLLLLGELHLDETLSLSLDHGGVLDAGFDEEGVHLLLGILLGLSLGLQIGSLGLDAVGALGDFGGDVAHAELVAEHRGGLLGVSLALGGSRLERSLRGAHLSLGSLELSLGGSLGGAERPRLGGVRGARRLGRGRADWAEHGLGGRAGRGRRGWDGRWRHDGGGRGGHALGELVRFRLEFLLLECLHLCLEFLHLRLSLSFEFELGRLFRVDGDGDG